MPIDVVSAGATPSQARDALEEAVHLFLSTAQTMNTLNEVRAECSYELRHGVWLAPEWVALERRTALLSA